MNKIRVYCVKCGWIGKDTFASTCPNCLNNTRTVSDYFLCSKHVDCKNFDLGKVCSEAIPPGGEPAFALYCTKEDSGCDRKTLYQALDRLPLDKIVERRRKVTKDKRNP